MFKIRIFEKMKVISIKKANRRIVGTVDLDGSKSISNRLLLIRALMGADFPIGHLSSSRDTETMGKLVEDFGFGTILDAGAAGTTFRFMTAYLALQDGSQVLTGSERMKERPVGGLVDALRDLGADIDYLEKDGFPPLRINKPLWDKGNKLSIPAGISSQYTSALLMIAPYLPEGLELTLVGDVVSRPYIEMTLGLMGQFGVGHSWTGNVISVSKQAYTLAVNQPVRVEADWSAASYYYAMAAFSDELDLQLNGLYADSLQGDSVVAEIMEQFGVHTEYNEGGVRLRKSNLAVVESFEWDFVKCPDIAQTLAVVCGGLGVMGLFTGLETLYIKETNRVLALQNELAKGGVYLSKLPARFSKKSDKQYYMIEGKLSFSEVPSYPSYEDHRMAMSFAPLGMLHEVHIEEPEVVGKSYPEFWRDIETLGFEVK
jgi:3-phosphoshikimate 1-carboxyvinyltransferase